ncbi:unnamed protein product, partial [Musa textilis]
LILCFVGTTKSTWCRRDNFPTFSVTCHLELLSQSRFIFHNKTCKLEIPPRKASQVLDRNGSVFSIDILCFEINFRLIIKEGIFLEIFFFFLAVFS